MVRGRVLKDMEYLRSALGNDPVKVSAIGSSPKADYPFRVNVLKGAWAEFLFYESLRIDYPNFKSRIVKTDPYRESVFHKVWNVMFELERKPKGWDRAQRKANRTTAWIDEHWYSGAPQDSLFDDPYQEPGPWWLEVEADEPWLCPDCAETLIGPAAGCIYCGTDFAEWSDRIIEDPFADDDELEHQP